MEVGQQHDGDPLAERVEFLPFCPVVEVEDGDGVGNRGRIQGLFVFDRLSRPFANVVGNDLPGIG